MDPQTSKAESRAIHLVNDRQVAELLGVSLATVRRWRLLNRGPRFLKLGASCKYKFSDVASWLESRPSGGERLAAR
jgi:excisionase family DNA binding protein